MALVVRECQAAIKRVGTADGVTVGCVARCFLPMSGTGGSEEMAQFSDPFETLVGLQQALDTFRASRWLAAGPSGGGS